MNWTTEQITFLKEKYHQFGAKFCADFLKRKPHTITCKAIRLGLIKPRAEVSCGNKMCSNCLKEQPQSCFKPQKNAPDKLSYMCNSCLTAYHRYHYQNSDKKAAYLRFVSRLQNPDKKKRLRLLHLLVAAKRRALNRKLDYNLDKQWLFSTITPACPVLGTPFTYSDYGAPRTVTNPSIDRVDNTKGYTKDNCIIVSLKANMMKGAGTPAELQRLANFYSNLRNADYSI